MGACEATGDPAHFDLVKAKEKLQTDPNGMYDLEYYKISFNHSFLNQKTDSSTSINLESDSFIHSKKIRSLRTLRFLQYEMIDVWRSILSPYPD